MRPISEYIVNRARAAARRPLLVGITGRAGAGKTTLTEGIADDLRASGLPSLPYSGDWRFILDSPGRRAWLRDTWRVGMDAYLNAINQHSWWDFDGIAGDLAALRQGRAVVVEGAYDRTTGEKSARIELGPVTDGVILYENCILGPPDVLAGFDIIVLLNTPDQVCLERILRKDAGRRSVSDIATRYLMTTYSENSFLQLLRERHGDRLVATDSDGRLGAFPALREVSHIPVPIHVREPMNLKRGTVFCDLDGTLVRHVPVPSPSGEDIELLDGTVEKLREFRRDGYLVVLTTGRSQSNVLGVLERLRALGLEFDQVICDLPIGPRHLINDSKGNEVRAYAHPIVRDAGIRDVKLP